MIVSGLAQGANFTSETAGYVYSANMYGNAIGGFSIAFFVGRIKWRPTAIGLLMVLISADLLSVIADSVSALYSIRFLHGLTGGALIGVGASLIARVKQPERTFAFLIFLQLSVGGVGAAIFPPLIPTMSLSIVWWSLAGFSGLALVLVPLLDDYDVSANKMVNERAAGRAPWLFTTLALVALFLYQAGQMAAFAYVIELGNYYRFDPGFIGITIAASLWVGGPAALLVAWWSNRSGRMRPICTGTLLTLGPLQYC